MKNQDVTDISKTKNRTAMKYDIEIDVSKSTFVVANSSDKGGKPALFLKRPIF